MISMSGEWFGHYIYGPEYGEELAGRTVTFKFSIEELADGQFQGTCIDFDGVSTQQEPIIIHGFVDNDYISFTKDYSTYYTFNEDGKPVPDPRKKKPELNYYGHFDLSTGIFSGDWELVEEIRPLADGYVEHIFTGTWEMKRR